MGEPFAISHFHIGEGCSERRVFRAACVYSERYLFPDIEHMADAHLLEVDPVIGILNTEIIFTTTEPEPNGFYGGIDICRRPIGIPVVCYHTAEPLYFIVFVFYRSLEPVFTVKLHNNAALIIADLSFIIYFYDE